MLTERKIYFSYTSRRSFVFIIFAAKYFYYPYFFHLCKYFSCKSFFRLDQRCLKKFERTKKDNEKNKRAAQSRTALLFFRQ